jgi:hypothetical protein
LKTVKASGGLDWEKNELEPKKAENKEYLDSLVAKGYITKNVAYILNYAYAELLYHRLRSTSGWMCYELMHLDYARLHTRTDLEKQLKLLSEISKKKIVDEKVIAQAKENIARDIEYLRRIKDLTYKIERNGYDKYQDEEKALLNLFKDDKVSKNIKTGKNIQKAAELIIKLSTTGGIN